jgi:transposase
MSSKAAPRTGFPGGWLPAQHRGGRPPGRSLLDPYAGYARGLADGLHHADLVVDHFHAVRLANAALDDVRRRVQQDSLGHRGRRGDPLYRIRRQLLVAHERLTDRGWARIQAGLDAGDPDGQVGAAYLAKELLREVYATRSLRQARRRLERFYAHCRSAEITELNRLAATVRRWEHEILGWHRTGLSNGPTEAMNLLVKKIKRVGHGFRNLNNYRLRLLLHCGVEWRGCCTDAAALAAGRVGRWSARYARPFPAGWARANAARV